MKRLGRIRCVSCGWRSSDEPEMLQPDFARELVIEHMGLCDGRFYGDPIFGFESRWSRHILYDTEGEFDEIELGWTSSLWGAPLHLEAA